MSATITIIRPIEGMKYDMVGDYFYIEKKKVGGDLTVIPLQPGKTYSNRLNRDIRKLKEQYSKYLISIWLSEYVAGEKILYRQGWYFKKKFFKNENTIYFATTKEKMIKILDKFMDGKRGAAEIYNVCLKVMQDGYIFRLAW